jgi:peptide/nickel transport system substrate-binding protein
VSQVPDAICEIDTDNGSRNLIINRAAPPSDKLELRRAMTLALDRKAFIDILVESQGLVGGRIGSWPPADTVGTGLARSC